MASAFRMFACAALLTVSAFATAAFEPGESTVVLKAAGYDITVYVYKPPAYAREGLIVSLHGRTRNAADYRRYSRPLADRFRGLLVVPHFDEERFPIWKYQYAGISRLRADRSGRDPMPQEQWTSEVLRLIIEQVRSREGAAEMPYVLIGHSAGGQFLSRVAAFTDLRPQRFVIANPGSWVAPKADVAFPFGFGGLPENVSNARALEQYVAQPITVLIGRADAQVDKRLPLSKGATAQGETRYPRALAIFDQAQAAAQERNGRFGWTLIEVPDTGHDARRMYASPLAADAFCPDEPAARAESATPKRAAWPCGIPSGSGARIADPSRR